MNKNKNKTHLVIGLVPVSYENHEIICWRGKWRGDYTPGVDAYAAEASRCFLE